MDGLTNEEFRELFTTFQVELKEQISLINEELLACENVVTDSEELKGRMRKVKREAHNIKGSARIVGLSEISALAQQFEEVLQGSQGLQQGTNLISKEYDTLYDLLDAMLSAIEYRNRGEVLDVSPLIELSDPNRSSAGKFSSEQTTDEETEELVDEEVKMERDGPQEGPVAVLSKTGDAKIESEEFIRVNTHKLDELTNFSAELLSMINKQQALSSTMISLQQKVSAIRQSKKQREGTPEETFGDSLNTMLVELAKSLRSLGMTAQHNTRMMARYGTLLQEGLKRTRMLPFRTITAGLQRMVRDLARAQNKLIQFSITGEEIRVDKHILEEIKSPLIHLLRNAIDHGLETPIEREKNGKPERGRLTLTIEQHGITVSIQIRDDGKGIDRDKVIAKAISRGIISEKDVPNLSTDEQYALLYLSGFSTRDMVTEISGRGVGLDVVKQKVEAMQGSLQLDTSKGAFTQFTIQLPVSLATSRIMLLTSGVQRYGIPSSAVQKIVRFKPSEVIQIEGKDVLHYQTKPIRIVSLEQAINTETQKSYFESHRFVRALLIRVGNRELFLAVTDILGETECVVKRIGEENVHLPGVIGATILDDSSVLVILNAAEILDLVLRNRTLSFSQSVAEQKKKTPKVLLVDDSITTRNFEKNLLLRAGYQVIAVPDGEQALAALYNTPVDIIVTDIQMPGIDGIGLTRRVKESEKYNHIPVILVSTLGSQEDIVRGLDAGADAYITKGSFEAQRLIQSIEQLL